MTKTMEVEKGEGGEKENHFGPCRVVPMSRGFHVISKFTCYSCVFFFRFTFFVANIFISIVKLLQAPVVRVFFKYIIIKYAWSLLFLS